ncbi:MAG: hypothetical protein AAF499_11805, partial [Pseudomonadota bacterium]
EGQIENTLANVAPLKVLDLCQNRFTGTLSAAFFRMPSLSTLALCQNQIEGELPDPSGATSLFDLDLSHNKIAGSLPAELFELPALWRLNLADNQLTGELPIISNLDSPLVTLNLEDNALSGNLAGKLTTYPNLSLLNLARNRLDGDIPDVFDALPWLHRLDISGNGFNGGIPFSIQHHAELLGANRDDDPSVDLAWNALTPSDIDVPWLQNMGMDVNRFVRPVHLLNATQATPGTWSLHWTPSTIASPASGFYRVETATGQLLAKTEGLDVSGLTLTTDQSLTAADLRVLTVVPPHAQNPSQIESLAAAVDLPTTARWRPPETVHYPSNFDAFESPNWGARPAGTTATVLEVGQADLFTESPNLSTAGSLRFTPAGREGRSDVLLNIQDAQGQYLSRFTIVLGPAANRAPSFTAGDDVNVHYSGQMQVIEWASALNDGDAGSQSLHFSIETAQASWFEFPPEISVPSGTMRFRAKAGQVGTAILRVRLIDNGGTASGGIDTSPVHTLRITLTEDANAVGGTGLASDAASASGGGALGLVLLILGWVARMRYHKRDTRCAINLSSAVGPRASARRLY